MSNLPLSDSESYLEPLDADAYPVSLPCFRYMRAHGFDPDMPVFRAIVSPAFMARTKALRPEVANTVQLLFGPFGIVDPRPNSGVFRVAELQVGTIVLDVEAEYEWNEDEPPAAP